MDKRKKIKKGSIVKEITTGISGKLADVQYEFNRYQFEHISNWRYGIDNLERIK
ncbi:hypothetical protein V7128_02030 [Neobacillus vireti]|uniref:hypothetical protein n=1 Tax=Neobacillus vireti TaxID=220686 RepID=UPI003000290D